jgi:hypothetical protein
VGDHRPRVIDVDGHPAYARAIAELKQSGELGRRCRCRPVPYLNNIIEQDHRFIKKRIASSLWFRSAEGATRTIDGYEAMHQIRKGQIRWLAKGDVVGQRHGAGKTLRRAVGKKVGQLKAIALYYLKLGSQNGNPGLYVFSF